VPERKPARDDQSNENADQKEPAISRKRDQQNCDHNDRDDEARRFPSGRIQTGRQIPVPGIYFSRGETRCREGFWVVQRFITAVIAAL
jgi:hypothetical protein